FDSAVNAEIKILQDKQTELSSEDEALLSEATEIVRNDRKSSISYIQRKLRIGYNRAATITELLEERGVLGPQIDMKPREILIN
ncbi:MAG: DNA translocase FtsK, partial [Verrucomicrobiota bacterium]|nr:DNA translocase FtsK [Verrucomicrobiota bacterium]